MNKTNFKVIVLLVILILLLAGCNKADTSSVDSTTKETENSSQENTSVITNEKEESSEAQEVVEEETIIEPIEAIIGKWTTTRDVSSDLREDDFEIKSKLNVTHYLQFTKKGKYAFYPSPDEMNNAVAKAMKDSFYKELKSQNITEDDFKSYYGMGVSDYVDKYLDTFILSYRVDGDYTIEENKITVKIKNSDETEVLKFEFIDENTLKITDDVTTCVYKRI